MSYLLVDEQWQVSEDRQSHYAHIVSKALNISGAVVGVRTPGELIRLAFYTVIWSLYFMKSKRVKATITRRRKNAAPPRMRKPPGGMRFRRKPVDPCGSMTHRSWLAQPAIRDFSGYTPAI